MLTTQTKLAVFPAQLFLSAKCVTALPFTDALTLEYLTQASLDPAVRKLEYVSDVTISGHDVRLDAILVHRHGRRLALNINETVSDEDADMQEFVALAYAELGLGVLQLTAVDLRVEPRFSNSRAVWRHSAKEVSHHERAAVCNAVEERGSVRIRDLDGLVQSGRPATARVCSLACECTLELDILIEPLGPDTVVRLGPKAVPSLRRRQESKTACSEEHLVAGTRFFHSVQRSLSL